MADMETGNLTWRWSADQLELLTQITRTGTRGRDPDDTVEVLAQRMIVALRAREYADDLVNRLMLALLDAQASPVDVAALMGVVSAQALKRRATPERGRLLSPQN